MSAIGTPSSVYFKSEEMNKMNASESVLSSLPSSNLNQQNDYFFNYITLGLVCLLNEALKINYRNYSRLKTYRTLSFPEISERSLVAEQMCLH